MLKRTLGFGCIAALFLLACTEGSLGERQRATQSDLYLNAKGAWKTKQIPVCWMNATAADREWMDVARNAVDRTWASVADIQFVGWDTCTTRNQLAIRIRIKDERPSAHVGPTPTTDHNMTLSFTPQANMELERWVRVAAVHEFGHALGFDHEQNRLDTPASCTQDGARSGGGGTALGDYDIDSVMNYCNPRWAGEGVLSKLDIEGAQKVYGKKGGGGGGGDPANACNGEGNLSCGQSGNDGDVLYQCKGGQWNMLVDNKSCGGSGDDAHILYECKGGQWSELRNCGAGDTCARTGGGKDQCRSTPARPGGGNNTDGRGQSCGDAVNAFNDARQETGHPPVMGLCEQHGAPKNSEAFDACGGDGLETFDCDACCYITGPGTTAPIR